MSRLDAQSTVAEWVTQQPRSARIFENLQIDYCCGGNVALTTACESRQLEVTTVMDQLQQVAAGELRSESSENWALVPLADLCDHIEETHHTYLRRELPRLSELIDKVVAAHGQDRPELRDLRRVFAALRAELEPHMFKEENILFPAIRQLEQAANQPSFPFGSVANPIRMMEHEHEVAGNALAQIRELTGGFLPPQTACNTYRVMLEALRELEADLHQHIHKENNILFPRAQCVEHQPVSTAQKSTTI